MWTADTVCQVTAGENAPAYREGAGVVAPGSLAAESVQAGGEFAQNRNLHSSDTTTADDVSRMSSTRPHEAPGAARASGEQQGQAAPTYVNSQLARDAGGPHGRNVTEDPGMTGRPGKFNVEVGSKEDPARQSERDMLLKQTKGAPGTGEREVGERGKDEQPYAALGGETSA